MLTGVEIIGGAALEESVLSTLDAIAPVAPEPWLLKVRWPGQVPVLAERYPSARFVVRNSGEGYDVGDMLAGYLSALPVLRGYRERIVAYCPANEPNYTSDPATSSGRDPWQWVDQALRFTNKAGEWPVPLMTPGLQPHHRIAEWSQALDSLWVSGYFPVVGYHAYWQSDGPEAAVATLQDWIAEMAIDPSQVLVDEFNGGHPSPDYQPTIEQRADECARAADELGGLGVLGGVVFAANHASGWSDFVLPTDYLRQVLAVGRVRTKPKRPKPARPKPAPEPVPEVISMAETYTFEQLEFEWPARLDDWRPEIRLNDQTGIGQAWLANRDALGPAITPEVDMTGGGRGQLFAGGRIHYQDGVGTEVVIR